MERSRNEALWALLTNEELAECSDSWRYEAADYRRRGLFGLAIFAERMSNEAYEVLVKREEIAAAAKNLGEQLSFTEKEYRRVYEPGA